MSIEIDASSVKGRTKYLYSATGAKLRVIHETDMNVQNTTVMAVAPFESEITDTKVTDYVGNKIYENGELKKILVNGGYYDCEKEEYFFYIQDHLGNNRVVVNQNDSVVQRSDYYPFGMEFADNTNSEEQPYKYNGKELDKTHGLNMYDYSARYVDPAYGRFTSVDPKAEKYYSLSPYAYCGNNPIRLVDVDGKEWGIVVNGNGTMTVTLNVGFTVASNLNLTTAQIDSYKAAISSQLNSTFMEASGGLISVTMSFDGGKDPNRFTPVIHLNSGEIPNFTPGYGPLVSLSTNFDEDLQGFGETGVHELMHTLALGEGAETPSIKDTRVIRGSNGYITTSTTDENFRKNVMLYGSTRINGKTYRDIYNSRSGMNRLTKGQLLHVIKNIYKQMQGYGLRPTKKANESNEEYEERKKKYHDDYWDYFEDEE